MQKKLKANETPNGWLVEYTLQKYMKSKQDIMNFAVKECLKIRENLQKEIIAEGC